MKSTAVEISAGYDHESNNACEGGVMAGLERTTES